MEKEEDTRGPKPSSRIKSRRLKKEQLPTANSTKTFREKVLKIDGFAVR